MQSLLSDLRYAIRELRKRPGFTVTAVLSLALGIGATSAVFSVIYAVLIDPFPYPGSDRIVELRLVDKAGNDRFTGLSGPQMDQLRQAKSLEDVGRAYDRAMDARVNIVNSLGQHSNDPMLSFYVQTPSGFNVELGWKGTIQKAIHAIRRRLTED